MKTIYLTPHTHYDVVWAFVREDYLYINTSILQDAMKMIKECGFKFLIEQSYPIEQIEQNDPEFFAEIKEAIQQKKIEVVDGQYVMADPMTPAGEVLVREFLFGHNYCKDKLGIDIPVAWAADGFGLNAQLPQIYRQCGFRWLVFRRGLPRSVGYRVSEFLWEGLDGTKILAHWLPLGYRAGLDLDKWEQNVKHLASLATSSHILMPCGSGGVPPQQDTPDRVKEWNQKHTDLQVIIATPREFFEGLEKDKPFLITFRGELYSADLEDIFPHSISSRIRLKLAIKGAEGALLMGEKMAGLARLYGRPYPTEKMTELWKKQLFLAHHDVSPGTGIDEIYEEAWRYINDIKVAMRVVMRDSARHLAPTKGKEGGKHFVVVNTNNWEATDWTEAEMKFPKGLDFEPAVSHQGEEQPTELIDPVRDKAGRLVRCKLGFRATAPSLGYRVYGITKKTRDFQTSIQVRDNEVTTPFFRLVVDRATGILHVFGQHGRKILTGNEIYIDEEVGDLYFHRSHLDQPIGAEGGGGVKFGAFKPNTFEINQTGLRTIVTYGSEFYCLRWPYYLTEKFGNRMFRHKTIDICKQVIVHHHSPRIDFVTTLNTEQSHVRIRLHFDTCMVAPTYVRQTQYGVVNVPRQHALEEGANVPSLSWVSVQEGGRGLAFLSDGVPINEIRSGFVHYTLLRSVSVLSSDGISGPLIPTPGAMQLGRHVFKYSVYPYEGDWREAGIHRRVAEFSHPLFSVRLKGEATRKEFQGLALEPDNLVVSALKKTEAEDSLLLRFFETKGEKCRAELTLPSQVKAVRRANLMERDEGEVPFQQGRVLMDVGPFEIVTLRLSLAS